MTKRRPPIASNPRTHTIQVRVTAAQRQVLQDAADREGFDLAPWLRAQIMRLVEKVGAT